MIVGRKNMPGADLKGLIAWLKANPGKASQGNPGTGSLGQVIGALFQKATGTQFQSVPYRGGGPALQDLVAGHIDLMIEPTSNFAQYIPSGAVKPYAVAAGTRVSAAPQVPTVDQAGLPVFYASLWLGLWLPKGTPKDVITSFNSAVIEALTDPAVRQRLADIGQSVPPREQQTPEALGAFQKAEIEKWWPIIKAANIKGDAEVGYFSVTFRERGQRGDRDRGMGNGSRMSKRCPAPPIASCFVRRAWTRREPR
jgi:tripartite-type tricarboxylate transporter receptor subunit TctC